ncbi:MAG: ROK family protein [Lachnospiraceae bacterium]|nr:ROK family protein [Lachnospiraceae bacterium]MDY2760375.1 ROK family protein [Lachnospiraceae bacterium]
MRIGALEAGGTKMVCAIGDETGKIYEQESFPTVTPEETLPQLLDYFKGKKIEALGIACFGPIDLDRDSDTYGYITTTPKTAWMNTDIAGYFANGLNVPVGFDTDVNGSLLGEVTYGQAKGLGDAVYYTIGTGVGAGVMSGGKLVHGAMHPEAGHMLLRVREDDPMPEGICPFHGACLEGMAAGPSIEKRWGKKAIEMKDDARVWDLEAYYLAQCMVTTTLMLSPKIIILGGGVMHQTQLFPLVREKTRELLNGYIKNDTVNDMDHYIVPASLHDDQGIMGCLKLGFDAV